MKVVLQLHKVLKYPKKHGVVKIVSYEFRVFPMLFAIKSQRVIIESRIIYKNTRNIQKQDKCQQWSTRSDPQSRQQWTLFSLEVCFVRYWKVGTDVRTDGQTDRRTDNMCHNNYRYRPRLWVGQVDQKYSTFQFSKHISITLRSIQWLYSSTRLTQSMYRL